jgi:hypothetical protein
MVQKRVYSFGDIRACNEISKSIESCQPGCEYMQHFTFVTRRSCWEIKSRSLSELVKVPKARPQCSVVEKVGIIKRAEIGIVASRVSNPAGTGRFNP